MRLRRPQLHVSARPNLWPLFRRIVYGRGRFRDGFSPLPAKKAYLAGIGRRLHARPEARPAHIRRRIPFPGDLAGAQAAHALRHAGPRQPGKLLAWIRRRTESSGPSSWSKSSYRPAPSCLRVDPMQAAIVSGSGMILSKSFASSPEPPGGRPAPPRGAAPHGDPPPADRADAARRGCLSWRQALILQAAVPVHMIFAPPR